MPEEAPRLLARAQPLACRGAHDGAQPALAGLRGLGSLPAARPPGTAAQGGAQSPCPSGGGETGAWCLVW